MRRAYLLIAIPGLLVGVAYVLVFRSLGLEMRIGPFVGAVGGFLGALLLVRRHLQRKVRRPGGSKPS
jgi:ABC-type Fe3+ transport system permease subunit